ncbi:MAG: hypothetical protein ACE5WD_00560 [Candidatus Aminicenantia bacterium]
MKNKRALTIMFFICFIFGNWCNCKSQMANQKDLKQKDLENYLRTAKIVSVEIDPRGGRMAAWVIKLDDGKIARRGYFKYINRRRPSFLPDSYKYEIAAYELDKLLDLNRVPPVVEREIKGIKGSLQLFIGGCITENDRKRRNIEPPDPKGFENTLEDINIFENLTYNERIDTDDILIHKEDWKVWRVDFSGAFSPFSELIPGCEITRCSKKLYQNFLKLDSKIVRAKLKPYLNDEEIEALLERKNIIIEKIQQLIEEKGEESVLFS